MKRENSSADVSWESVLCAAPVDRDSLRGWALDCLGMVLPERAVCVGNATPLDYLEHSFFERPGDAVVWACRGGGKTKIAAAATLLDMLYKPGLQVRILAGSKEQGDRMYEYLREMLWTRFRDMVAGRPTKTKVRLTNGSAVEVLAQADTSVRGQRVQKVRCDEVELFDRRVWSAAQLVTKGLTEPRKTKRETRKVGDAIEGLKVRGAVEAFSTMHVPGGLMEEIVGKYRGTEARSTEVGGAEVGGSEGGGSDGVHSGLLNSEILNLSRPAGTRKVFRWNVWDVVERCPDARACEGCALWGDCRGRAKEASGFVGIEDLIAMKGRVSRAVWEGEMLCTRPRMEGAVFEGFVPSVHVVARTWPELDAMASERWGHGGQWVCGVDFGLRQFACLLMHVSGKDATARVYVADELVVEGRALGPNVAAMWGRQRPGGPWPGVDVVHCDVAGTSMNTQTGRSDVSVVKGAGFNVKCRTQRIEEGIEKLEELLEPAAGPARILIHPRCVKLIGALQRYRRDAATAEPIKDGRSDHCVDALRYAVCGVWPRSGGTVMRVY